MSALITRSAGELAQLIQNGTCSATEALEAHLDRVDALNDQLNIVVAFDVERARARAGEADAARARGEIWGPLHGVPMTVKDAFETQGMKTTFGVPFLKNHVPVQDATVVARLRAAGAVIFGKTNVPTLCYDWQCVHPEYGRTVNPHDVGRSPGGSSGGAAAALAAAMTPLEIGSDIAGSIRVPCHFCGVAGIRPTEGSVSAAGATQAPGYPRTLRSFFAAGPMARTVADLRVVLPLVRGSDPRDWLVAPFPAETPVNDKPPRVAFSTGLGGVPIDSETRQAVESLAEDLEGEGWIVEDRDPPGFDFVEALEVWGRIQGFECAGALPFPLRWGLGVGSFLGAIRWRLGGGEFTRGLSRGTRLSSRGYFRALTRRDELVAVMESFLRQWDLWICPVAATPAFTHRRPGSPVEVEGRRVSYSRAMGMYNCPTALAANPVVALPVARSRAGLPIGVQVHAARWRDDQLLAGCQVLEMLRPPLELRQNPQDSSPERSWKSPEDSRRSPRPHFE